MNVIMNGIMDGVMAAGNHPFVTGSIAVGVISLAVMLSGVSINLKEEVSPEGTKKRELNVHKDPQTDSGAKGGVKVKNQNVTLTEGQINTPLLLQGNAKLPEGHKPGGVEVDNIGLKAKSMLNAEAIVLEDASAVASLMGEPVSGINN